MNTTHTPERIVAPPLSTPPANPGGEDFDLNDPIRSFVQVAGHVAFEPVRFFARVRRKGSYLAPLTFAMIIGVIGNGLGILASLLGIPGIPAVYDINRPDAAPHGMTIDIGSFHRHLSVGEPFGGGIGAAAVYGLMAIAGVLLFIWMLYLAERLVIGRRNAGPEATFRVVAYASVPELLAWVPLVGGLFSLYGVYLTVVGLREMHQTTTSQAVKVFFAAIGMSIAATVLIGLVVAPFIMIFA